MLRVLQVSETIAAELDSSEALQRGVETEEGGLGGYEEPIGLRGTMMAVKVEEPTVWVRLSCVALSYCLSTDSDRFEMNTTLLMAMMLSPADSQLAGPGQVGPAWGMLQAIDRNAESTHRSTLKAAHLLLLPGYAFSYEYLGMPSESPTRHSLR